MKPSRRTSGFTLIEVLAAVTVLSIMLIMLGRLFSDATTAMDIGISASEQNAEGRAALNFVAKELSMAVTGEDNLILHSDLDSGLLNFVTLHDVVTNDTRGVRRKATQVQYAVKSFTGTSEGDKYTRDILQRDAKAYRGLTGETITAYEDGAWWSNAGTDEDRIVSDNIGAFKIALCDTNGTLHTSGTYDSSIDENGPPVYAELYLEILGKRIAKRVDEVGVRPGYAKDHSQYYFRRVYFNNFIGYNRDRKRQ